MLHRNLLVVLVSAGLCFGQISFDPSPGMQRNPPNQQQPNASLKRYPVSGSVVNSMTGAPVPRAVVRVFGVEPSQTFTDDSGHFELKDVPEGRASLFAQRPGFQPAGRNFQQQITVSQSTSSVQLKLMPQSSLRGRVLNSDGEPIEGLQVQLMRQQVVNGLREWQPANGASTDEAGTFMLDDLTPGTYLLRANSRRVFLGGSSVVVDGRHFPDLYPAQYYPNSPDQSSAQGLQVAAGTEAQVDWTITAVPSYSVSGTLGGARNAFVTCDTPEGENVSTLSRMERDGRFSIAVPAGACILRARTGGMRGSQGEYAELPISVNAADVTGVQLNLEPLPKIPVVVNSAVKSANPSAPGASVELRGRQQRGPFQMPPQMRQEGENMMMTSVAPGSYRVIVHVHSGDACVGSVTSGSVDLLKSELTVSPGGSLAPIEVTLRNDCGSITGKLDGSNGTDPAMILLIPEAAPSQAKMSGVSGGTVQFKGLTPGDYIVVAAPDLSGFPYAEPEALKTVSGQKVTVGPNAEAPFQLQISSSPVEAR